MGYQPRPAPSPGELHHAPTRPDRLRRPLVRRLQARQEVLSASSACTTTGSTSSRTPTAWRSSSGSTRASGSSRPSSSATAARWSSRPTPSWPPSSACRPAPGCAFYDLIVVGSGPTGLTTALYAAREGLEMLVIERSGLGGQAGVTERLDNFPGFPDGISGAEFADRLRRQAAPLRRRAAPGPGGRPASGAEAQYALRHYRRRRRVRRLRRPDRDRLDLPPPRHPRRGRPDRRRRPLLRHLRRPLLPRPAGRR